MPEINIQIYESGKVAIVFNSYFESVTESVDLFNWATEPCNQEEDSVEKIIHKFSHHPTIIHKVFEANPCFHVK